MLHGVTIVRGNVGVECDMREGVSEELCEVLGYLRVRLWLVVLFFWFMCWYVGLWWVICGCVRFDFGLGVWRFWVGFLFLALR